jgi:hypothetical protein
LARVLLEEMLPGAVAGVHEGEAIAIAPGAAAVLDQIRDVAGDLAGIYGPGAGAPDMVPGWYRGASPAEYPGDAPGPHAAVTAPGSLRLAFGVSRLSAEASPSRGDALPGGAAKSRRGGPPGGDAPPGGGRLPEGRAQLGPRAGAGPAGRDGGAAHGAGGGAAHGPGGGTAHGAGGGADVGRSVAGLARSVDQARQASRIAALLGAGVHVVDAAGLGSIELLLATAPAEARRAFRASLLAPLQDYDADHGTELVRTLRVFLDCSGSWTRAAEAMFVHVNSLRYRIRRVEELTGRDLGSLADQAALLLALRLD